MIFTIHILKERNSYLINFMTKFQSIKIKKFLPLLRVSSSDSESVVSPSSGSTKTKIV